MTIAEIISVARNAGFSDANLATAVAIALAESGGDSGSIGDVDLPHSGCRSYGLWQINYCPDRDQGSRPAPSVLLTASGNADFAYKLSQGGANWHPWTVYNTGAYLIYLPRVKAELAKAPSSTPAGGGSAPPGPDCSGYCSKMFPNFGLDQFCLIGCQQGCAACEQYKTPEGLVHEPQYSTCLAGCHQTTYAGNAGGTSCSDCGTTNLPACFSCAADFLSKGLRTIGTNIALFLIVLVGVYLLFKDDIDPVIKETVSEGKKAAEMAALA